MLSSNLNVKPQDQAFEDSLKMSENGNPEQEDFEAQVTDSVLADEEDVKPAEQKTADKAIGRSRSRSTSKHKSRSYRSRSRSRSYSRSRRSRRHRSRSYDRYEGRHKSSRYREGRSHSRSPMSNRRRHHGDRENPTESPCLGVFGLSLYTTERDLRDVYEHYGTLTNVNVVYDHQTGRSRGFAFVTFTNVSDAREARESTNGTEVDGRRIRVDYSITERAHTPTPGVYMGKPTGSRRDSYRDRGYHSRGYHRSPSPHYYRRSPSPYYRRTPSPHYYRRSPSPYYRHHHHHSRRHHYYPRDRSFSPSRY